jgi:hypothetical protein
MQFITKFSKEKHKNATAAKAMLMKGESVTFHLVTASYTQMCDSNN